MAVDLQEPVGGSAAPGAHEELGQRRAHPRPRRRRHRGRDPVSQHDPSVFPERKPHRDPADRRGVRAALGGTQGPQPLDGRLLRAGARPARRRRADHAQQCRRRGLGGEVEQASRSHRRDSAARRAARLDPSTSTTRRSTSRSGRRARSTTSPSTATAEPRAPSLLAPEPSRPRVRSSSSRPRGSRTARSGSSSSAGSWTATRR